LHHETAACSALLGATDLDLQYIWKQCRCMDVVDLLNEKRLAFVILLPQLRSVGFTRVKVKFSKQGWNEISQHRVEFYVMLPTSSHYDDDMNAKAKQKTLQTM